MKKIFFAILTVFVSYQTVLTAQTADEIVQKHLAAIGGVDKLNSIKSMKMVGSIEIQPGMTAPITMQVINNRALRMDLSIMGMTMNQVVYDNSGWAVVPFNGNPNPEPLTQDQVKEMKKQTDLSGDLLNYKDKGSKIELIGSEDVEGTDTHKVKITEKDGTIGYKFFDKTNFYLIKETKILKLEDKETEVSILYSNFKKTETGFVFAYSMNNEMAGGPITWESFEVNPTIDEAIFKMPAKN
ncbi:MAG: hypothetical protein JNK41_06950 [Saprospiraceae bacterium]|nr:hypothetical protein [Saprospiraceae bacterium]